MRFPSREGSGCVIRGLTHPDNRTFLRAPSQEGNLVWLHYFKFIIYSVRLRQRV